MKNFKLGKLAKKHDSRNLLLANYVDDSAFPPIPPAVDWSAKIPADWGMMKNDTYGDCVIAAAGHAVENWTGNASTLVTPTDDQILNAYSAITGFDPAKTDANGDNPTDQGTNELDALKYWMNTGIAGHKIAGFVEVNPKNINHVKLAVALFGVLFIGIQVPSRAMDEFSAGKPWNDVAPDSIEGGHGIIIVGYDADGVTVVTWGKTQKASWGWLSLYMDECYALISNDFLESTGVSPAGLNMVQMQADIKAAKN